MNIIGLEVLPGSPGGLAIGAVPPEKVELTYGQKLRVNTSFGYRGLATKVTLYGSIGHRDWIQFWEDCVSEQPIDLPESKEFTPCVASVDIPITADISPGSDYDIYCKIKEYPGAGLPQVDDVITITGMPPTFELLEETIYPYAYVYDGKCDVCTFTFRTDPFTPASWIAGKLAAACENEVEKAGGRVMEMRVYVDRSPLLWTDWRIEVVGIPPKTTAGVAMSLGIAWWAIAIIAALAIILIIVITWSIKTIVSSFTHKPISEEIKATWSKDTLIKVIGDFETKLERTPTPPEELEKKSEDELRKYCDELASAIAPAPGGLGLAIAAAGVLGLGALALGAYAMSRPRETGK
jgi:hypothetical protein